MRGMCNKLKQYTVIIICYNLYILNYLFVIAKSYLLRVYLA